TPLPARLPLHLAERLPQPQCAIAHGQGGAMRQATAFEVEQESFPGLRALPITIPEAHQCFLATGVSPNNHQKTMPRVLQPGLQVPAVAPAIDIAFARQVPLLPLRQFLRPPLLEPAQRGRGPPRRLRS